MTVSLQFNSTLTVPQDSANQIAMMVSQGNAQAGITGETGLVGVIA
jgi:ATP phosphoribosyltransferase